MRLAHSTASRAGLAGAHGAPARRAAYAAAGRPCPARHTAFASGPFGSPDAGQPGWQPPFDPIMAAYLAYMSTPEMQEQWEQEQKKQEEDKARRMQERAWRKEEKEAQHRKAAAARRAALEVSSSKHVSACVACPGSLQQVNTLCLLTTAPPLMSLCARQYMRDLVELPAPRMLVAVCEHSRPCLAFLPMSCLKRVVGGAFAAGYLTPANLCHAPCPLPLPSCSTALYNLSLAAGGYALYVTAFAGWCFFCNACNALAYYGTGLPAPDLSVQALMNAATAAAQQPHLLRLPGTLVWVPVIPGFHGAYASLIA